MCLCLSRSWAGLPELSGAAHEVPHIVSEPYDAIAPYYALIVAEDELESAMYAGFARRTDAPVLELAVGDGRVAVPLARQGAAVHGIDSSAAMLERARDRAAAAGVRLRLAQAGMCDYRFAERFGLIYCAIDSFLHLCSSAGQLAALRLAGDHLCADGRLVLDLPALTSGRWSEWEPGVRPLELVWSGAGPDGGTVQYFTTFTADPTTQLRRVTHIFDEVDATGAVRRTCTGVDLRFIFPGELELLVAAAGLRLHAVYGDYDLSPFAAGCERMIAVITRHED